MVKRTMVLVAVVGLCGGVRASADGPGSSASGSGLQLVEADRVVFLGNALIEREQRYGYWEAALVSRYPDRNIMFRNLGWSGDTVFGEARAGFGSPLDGFNRLKEHVAAVKPTAIVVAYGLNESFEGEAGLPRFQAGLNRLLDTLTSPQGDVGARGVRIVLMSPFRLEDLGRPLPDPAGPNKNLRLYCDALRKTAEQHGYGFINLYDLPEEAAGRQPTSHLTDDEVHLTGYGYWRTAPVIAAALGPTPAPWRVELDAKGKVVSAEGTRVLPGAARLSYQVTDAHLPLSPPPGEAPADSKSAGQERVLHVRGLGPGCYVLRIDGRSSTSGSAAEWAAGVRLTGGPEFAQAERLRQAVIEKNRSFFHRDRPENETYLFGFRKHEQGRNAREIPEFDPVVARLEAEIARLRVPVAHQYELVRQGEVGR